MGDTADTGVTLVVIAIAIFLLMTFWGQGFFPIGPHWLITISTSPVGVGNTVPFGNVSITADKGLTVNASEANDWSFSYWIFDNKSSGSMPTLTLPKQSSNFTHTLVAVYIPKTPTFQILPSTMAFGKGVSTQFTLTLKNNGNFGIGSIHIKLIDPDNVFSQSGFPVGIGYMSAYYIGPVLYGPAHIIFEDINNRFSTESLKFWANPSNVGTYSSVLNASSSGTIVCGGCVGWSTDQVYVATSSTIPAGTYPLTFQITFQVTSGDYSAPPYMNIPWTVTILG